MKQVKYELKLTIYKAPIDPVTYSLFFDPADYHLHEHLYWLNSIQCDERFTEITGKEFTEIKTEQDKTLAYHFDCIFGPDMASKVFEYSGQPTLVNITNEVDKGILFYNNEIESRRRIKEPSHHYESVAGNIANYSQPGAYRNMQNNKIHKQPNNNIYNNRTQSSLHSYYGQPIKKRHSPGCLTSIAIIFIILTIIVLGVLSSG